MGAVNLYSLSPEYSHLNDDVSCVWYIVSYDCMTSLHSFVGQDRTASCMLSKSPAWVKFIIFSSVILTMSTMVVFGTNCVAATAPPYSIVRPLLATFLLLLSAWV